VIETRARFEQLAERFTGAARSETQACGRGIFEDDDLADQADRSLPQELI
jgi:hypothetical protein